MYKQQVHTYIIGLPRGNLYSDNSNSYLVGITVNYQLNINMVTGRFIMNYDHSDIARLILLSGDVTTFVETTQVFS